MEKTVVIDDHEFRFVKIKSGLAASDAEQSMV
jgi:hypothetical protein